MSWLRMDDRFASHPKIAQLSDKEFRIWVRTLCFCAMYQDPTVDKVALSEVPGLTRKTVARFTEFGLLDEVGESLEIHDWAVFQPKDMTGADRQAKWRARNGSRNGSSNDTSATDSLASRARIPVPSRTSPKEQDLDPKPIARIEEVQVWEAWTNLAPPLIAHRESYFSAAKTRSAIAGALRLYPVDAVVEAVQNYAAVLGGTEYRWDHSWTIIDFLNRGLDKFVPEARPLDNFRVHRELSFAERVRALTTEVTI